MNRLCAFFLLQRQQRRRRRYTASPLYSAAIALPVTGGMTLPAAGEFAIRPEANNAGTSSVLIVDMGLSTERTIGIPALTAGQFHPIGPLRAGAAVLIDAGFDLCVATAPGVWAQIVEGASA